MAVKVHFEIGHTAKLKSKKTPDGFTHDWELYVRGTDKSDISHFVEKVVFNLHDSFPKPKRVFKEAPYVLKESGYAGFVLPIDIHFRNRDEPKRVTFNYDLDLQQTGPPVHRNEIKKYAFNNPSDDFRRKLLKGGGILLVNNADEKSRDSVDERSQSSKPKLMNNDEMKKLKTRPEVTPMQTFTKLFGTPIKTSSKVSPDPKNKSSPNLSSASSGGKSSKTSEKTSSSSSVLVKEKLEKTEKKDKHKHNSPHKEKLIDGMVKENKKNSAEEKHERRTEKKKDKSHSKERDRSREKSSKRPLSPKRLPSPKRTSPARSSSAASRGEENGFKPSVKTIPEVVGINNNNNSEKSSNSGSSTSKKSKKEKKSYDKDREREKKEKDRERKDKEDRSSNNSTPIVAPSILNHAANLNTKVPINEVKQEYNKKEKEVNSTGPPLKDVKDLKKGAIDVKMPDVAGNSDKKIAEKHDKDAEKRHKHKKKDKNKEKDKDKDYALKDKKKDKLSKKDDLKKTPQSQSINEPVIPPQKPSTNSSNVAIMHDMSDGDSPDSDAESQVPSVSERPENITESSNSSLQDIVTKTVLPVIEEPKIDKKERKSRDKTKVDKDEKKRNRKRKDDIDTLSRKSDSPAINNSLIEPPIKQSKKDELLLKNGEKSNSPQLSISSTSSSNNSLINPSSSSNQPLINDDSTPFRAPSTSAIPVTPISNINSHERSLTVDYMSELRDLQHKIMTLQDNNELQQVVEMIAATGQFEVTTKTFDFDLCKLDRNTVQKLQNFFATSCS